MVPAMLHRGRLLQDCGVPSVSTQALKTSLRVSSGSLPELLLTTSVIGLGRKFKLLLVLSVTP